MAFSNSAQNLQRRSGLIATSIEINCYRVGLKNTHCCTYLRVSLSKQQQTQQVT